MGDGAPAPDAVSGYHCALQSEIVCMITNRGHALLQDAIL